METLSPADIAGLLQPYLSTPADPVLCDKVGRYLDLLAHWNTRVSLTSVRDPEQIVQRHFGESFFLAEQLPHAGTLLDFGSGAGFPGIPVALLRPNVQVTLAESQGKKASFLREAVAELGVQATVWADRVEKMPVDRQFDIVALRAVDKMETALRSAMDKVAAFGTLAYLAGEGTPILQGSERWQVREVSVPLSSSRLVLATKIG